MTHSFRKQHAAPVVRCRTIAGWLLGSLLCAGCGESLPETIPVEGQITVGSRPLPGGRIVFFPEQGRAAMGRIGPDGSYRLTTFRQHDGALPGAHRVIVEAPGPPVPSGGTTSWEDELKPGFYASQEFHRLVPAKYAEVTTSGLTAEVSLENRVIDFALEED